VADRDRLCRSGGQYAILGGKECKLQAIGNARLVTNTAQIVFDHLFGGTQAQRNSSVEWNPVKIPLHSHPSIGIDGWIRTRCKDGPPLHVDLRDYVQPFGVSY
jgi:hypothetical protein